MSGMSRLAPKALFDRELPKEAALVKGTRNGSGREHGLRGRLLAAVVVAGLLCVAAVVLAGVALALSGGPQREVRHRLPGSRAPLVARRGKTDPSAARASRLVWARRARHQRWLESPGARSRRVASRMAFHGLGVSAAKGLLMRDYGSAVRAAGAVASVSRVTKASVVGYVNPYKAEVRGPRGLAYVNSVLPLAHAVDGRERPVDLALKSNGAGFAPMNSPLRIARRLSGGVSLQSSGIRVAMEGRNVRAVPVGASAVFFSGVAEDVDATVAPTDGGMELFATLRSGLSPQELRYRFTLPSGAVLRQMAGGSIEVWRRGRVLATVSPPSATDAQGQSVPVTVAVAGDQLVLYVAHRAHDFAYPILVDPKIYQEHGASAWTFQKGVIEGGEFVVKSEGPFVARETPGGIEAPKEADYENPKGKVAARWVWQGPAGDEITAVTGLYSDTTVPEISIPAEFLLAGYVESGCGDGEAGYGVGYINFTPFDSNTKCPATSKLQVLYQASGGESHYYHYTGYLSVYPIWVTEAVRSASEDYGRKNRAEPNIQRVNCGNPVNCATGNDFYAQTDLAVGGNPGLGLTRTYNSELAATQTSPGSFGYGWTASYGAYLSTEYAFCGSEERVFICSHFATIHQDNGSTVTFEEGAKGWVARGVGVQATLSEKYPSESFEYTLPGGKTLDFSKTGRLTSEINASGTTTTLTYNEGGQLTKAEEEAKRSITFAYNEEGLVKEATDPQGTVKYTYVSGNLTEVTDLDKQVWKFGYNGSHELTSQTDPLGHAVTTEYSGEKVISQTDAMERTRTWKYVATESGTETTVTNPTGAVTVEHYNNAHLPTSITSARGTSIAATTTFEYDARDNLIAVTDPNKHTTKYEYDAAGDRTSETNPVGDKTEWTYDGLHEVLTTTTPDGEKTTIKRNAKELPETISRPAPSGTQTTTYKYDAKGDLESVEDPLKRVWKYGYDSYGDRTSETGPEGNKRTWGYNEASQETSTVSPRGNAAGAEPALYKTTIERDALGRPLTVTEPGGIGSGAPVKKTPATISGIAHEGQTLSAGTGIWEGAPTLSYSYQWQHCSASGGSCSNVSGATGSTYLLASGDVGDTLRVVVTATNLAGSASSTSEATAVVSNSTTLGAVYVSQFGSEGAGDGQFDDPVDVAVGTRGNLWVTDHSNSRVEEFSEAGEFVKAFGWGVANGKEELQTCTTGCRAGIAGMGSGQVDHPTGIVVDPKGNVWVGEYSRIQEFDEEGEFEKAVGSEGKEDGQFEGANWLATDSHNDIWVSDSFNGRVQEFNEEGIFLDTFGSVGDGDGQFQTVGGIVIAPDGDAWVADAVSNRVEEFISSGTFIETIGFGVTNHEKHFEICTASCEAGIAGSGSGEFKRPRGVAADPGGNIWVVDSENGRVEEFNEKGEYLAQFGSKGSGAGQLSYPQGVASNSSGDLWVADSTNNRIEMWKSADAPSVTGPASISGELLAGQTLSAGTGVWSAIPNPTYTYQWQRCNKTGGECGNISGATSSTHVVTESDIGNTLRVVVKATNWAGSTESTSAATEVVDRPRVTKYTYDADGNLETHDRPQRQQNQIHLRRRQRADQDRRTPIKRSPKPNTTATGRSQAKPTATNTPPNTCATP